VPWRQPASKRVICLKLHATSFGLPASHHSLSEDAYAVTPGEGGGVLCVLSDGVGAARDPRRCAQRVVRLVSDNFSARPKNWPIRKVLERLVDEANSSLCREGAYLDGITSMQATLAAVSVSGNKLCGINVGDSPVFMIRSVIIECLSENHSKQNGDGQDMLTNAVGMSDAVAIHYFEKEVQEGDLILIASDGLTKLLPEQELPGLAAKLGSARSLVREAVSRADATAHDDVSVILIEVKEGDVFSADLGARALHEFPKPERGLEIDGYRLIRPMAGFQRVWLSEKAGKRFILKFVPEEAERDEEGSIHARFAREVWNACRFKEEYFVPSFMPASGSPHYYVMEYIEAPSLSFLLKTRRLASDEVVELGRFLCKACQCLLSSELVHGDIKPENILIFRTGDGLGYKLLDLGLASPVFTDTGVSGTPTYLAPERFSGAVITERTETYAIGATLYEMLTGHPPFGLIERFQKPQFGRIKRPSQWSPNVPTWLDAVVLKSLSLKEDQRYQHFSELLFALENPAKAPLEILRDEPLLQRNPLAFYKAGFWLLLMLVAILLFKLSHS